MTAVMLYKGRRSAGYGTAVRGCLPAVPGERPRTGWATAPVRAAAHPGAAPVCFPHSRRYSQRERRSRAAVRSNGPSVPVTAAIRRG
ncbi:hypothetical protein Aca07nite_41040 [Actinoplanes capillaceus]|uniref:Uncharacterized protein n=1 Tax=Actinoplanes campanulatus TaxID=113559 RepID=A0ABQ3WKT1_9ACTN|nr:hypothetical protein Aca07nite_41040 [Actinoplanes capillaceus]